MTSINRDDLTAKLVIASLASKICPACGGAKGAGKTLCFRDFCALPGSIKQGLYRRVGAGYEGWLWHAFNFLNADKFHKPLQQRS